MDRRDAFASCHPIVNLMYFICVIGYAMAFTNPVCLGISFITAFVYSCLLRGAGSIKKNLIYMIPIMILTALFNPAFSHQGVTILTYLPSGNPLTLESIIYGIIAAGVLVTVICWFVCFNEVMTSDRYVYLFGKAAPALSLILSMTLRFVPEFIQRYKITYAAGKAAGLYANDATSTKGIRTWWRRKWAGIKMGVNVMSATVTWALERGISTSDSMKSRGYGLKGRKAYSIFRFDKRDGMCMIYIILCAAYVLVGGARGALSFRCYPDIVGKFSGAYTISVYVVYGMLAILPVVMNIREEKRWTYIESKI